jgi:hypothetical protein
MNGSQVTPTDLTYRGIDRRTGDLICVTGKVQTYDSVNINRPICRTAITNCRYYRLDTEMCFECENGNVVTADGICTLCPENKIGINIRGERVCVVEIISNCELYSVNGDVCLACLAANWLELDG